MSEADAIERRLGKRKLASGAFLLSGFINQRRFHNLNRFLYAAAIHFLEVVIRVVGWTGFDQPLEGALAEASGASGLASQ